MKQIFTLFFVCIGLFASAQTTDVFNITSYTALPAGWVGTNNIVVEPIVKSTYFLTESGNPGDVITTTAYDLSTYSTAKFFINVATFNTGSNNPAKIEISYDGGMTFTQTATTATPTSSSYVTGFVGGLALTGSLTSNVVIKISSNGTSGRGVRLQALRLEGTVASSNSTSSNIIATPGFTPTANVDYKNFIATDVLATNSLELGQFTIQDGGGAMDADALGTSLSSISFSLSNSSNFEKIALYDGTTEIFELTAAPTLNFTGLTTLVAADNDTKIFSLRGTFKSTVTDNLQSVATITAANAAISGSGFAAANAGGAATSNTGDNNRVEVTADRLAFVQNAINPTAPNAAMNPAPTVSVIDLNNSRDLDFVSVIAITSTGTLSAAQSEMAVAGLATFNAIIHTTTGTGFTLTATATGLTPANSTTFDIATVYNGVPLITPDALVTIDFDNTLAFSNVGQLSAGVSNSGASGTLNSNTWAIASSGSETSPASFGTNTSNIAGLSNPGVVTSGGFFPMNLGSGNVGLGIQPTGSSFTPGFIALKLQNNLGTTLNAIDLSYTLYGVNNEGQSNSVKLYFSTDNTTYIEVTGMTYKTISTSANTDLLKQYRAVKIDALNIANGNNLYIKWFIDDAGGSGSRDELVIDDIKLVPASNNTKLEISGAYQTAVTNTLVSLTGNTTITDSLGILNSIIELNSFDLTTPKIYNANDAYLVIKNTGSLILKDVGTTPKFAPIGASGSDYTPVTISNAGIVDDFTIHPYQTYSDCLTTAQRDSSVALTVDIKEAQNGGSNVTLSIDYNDATQGNFFVPASAVIAHCGTGNIVDYSGGTVAGSVVTLSGITSFSPFFVTSTPIILPTKLKSFVVENNNNTNTIKWSVADQIIGEIYDIEMSTNGSNFEKVGTVTASNQTNYSYNHATGAVIAYYRLKVKQLSGTSFYSNTIKVDNTPKALLINAVYPNPIQGNKANVQITSKSAINGTIQLIDAKGSIVYKQTIALQKGNQVINLDFATIPVGVYQLSVVTATQSSSSRLILQ